MKKIFCALLTCVLALIARGLSAQEDIGNPDLPKGSPILTVFANVHSGLSAEDRSSAFEVKRAYLGYGYRFDPHFSTEVKINIGSPEDTSEFSSIRQYAYFKTAALYWNKQKWTLKGGILNTEHFAIQERYWKHRYIYKSMQGEHNFGPKADLGATVIYRIHGKVELDASLMNGEGYRQLQRDDNFKASMGITCFPFERLLLRAYFDFINREVWQSTLSTFAGYRAKRITAGAEYNRKGNAGYAKTLNQTGLSAYLSIDINEQFEAFGRFDRLSSNRPEGYSDPWNLSKDGSAVITGIQYRPIDHVRIALNYRDWLPSAAGMGNLHYIYLNLEVEL